MNPTTLFLVFILLICMSESLTAFLIIMHEKPARPRTISRLVDDDQEVVFGSSGLLDSTEEDAASLMTSLRERQATLKQGIGKRYVARTQLGFLNVHYEPTNPHDTHNVVGRLEEGQIVTSTGPMRGFWIPHDGGGWSISKYGGFTWLDPIDE
jgi:hypothetical protein